MLHNRKAKLVKDHTLGQDERVDTILNCPESPLALIYKVCEELNKNKLKKGYIESCLICSEDYKKISDVLELPQEVLEFYRDFFFDIRGWDRLSKIEHIENLPSRDINEANLKLWAMNNGLDFIAWRLGKRSTISPVDGLQDLYSICMYKSKEAMFAGTASEVGKEGTKWIKSATDIARLLKLWTMDSSAAKRDLELAIREVVPEFEGFEDLK